MVISCLVIKAEMVRSIFKGFKELHLRDGIREPLIDRLVGIIVVEKLIGSGFSIHQEQHLIDVEELSFIDEKDGVVGCCSG